MKIYQILTLFLVITATCSCTTGSQHRDQDQDQVISTGYGVLLVYEHSCDSCFEEWQKDLPTCKIELRETPHESLADVVLSDTTGSVSYRFSEHSTRKREIRLFMECLGYKNKK